MKTKVIKVEEVLDIIFDYWNQIGETISEDAKNYLIEQVEMMSIEVDLDEANDLLQLEKKHKETIDKLNEIIDKLKDR